MFTLIFLYELSSEVQVAPIEMLERLLIVCDETRTMSGRSRHHTKMMFHGYCICIPQQLFNNPRTWPKQRALETRKPGTSISSFSLGVRHLPDWDVDPGRDTNRTQIIKHEVRLRYAGPDGGLREK
jgi:hypothetical protein